MTIQQIHESIIQKLNDFVDDKIEDAGTVFNTVATDKFAEFILSGDPLHKVVEASLVHQLKWK